MENFLTASPETRQQILEMAAHRSGVSPRLLERDWWQSFVLKNIFKLSLADHFTLNGSRALRHQ